MLRSFTRNESEKNLIEVLFCLQNWKTKIKFVLILGVYKTSFKYKNIYVWIKYCGTDVSDRDFIIVTNDDAFIISIIGLVRYILQIRSYIMKNTRINNPIAYISNHSSYNICLKPIGCSSRLVEIGRLL